MYKIEERYHPIIELALEVGALQRQFFRKDGLEISTKSSTVDMVTEADIACDQLIVNRIKELFPLDEILSEEQGLQPLTQDENIWLSMDHRSTRWNDKFLYRSSNLCSINR